MTGQEQVQRTTYPIVGPLGKFTWRMLAVVLAGQAIAVFFGAQVARGLAIAEGNPGLGQQWLWIGIGISLLAVLALPTPRPPKPARAHPTGRFG